MKWFVITLCLVCGIAVAHQNGRVYTTEGHEIESQAIISYPSLVDTLDMSYPPKPPQYFWWYGEKMQIVPIAPDTLTVKWAHLIFNTNHLYTDENNVIQFGDGEEFQLGLRSDGVVVWREKE